jgi:hypothetical protein
MKDYSFNELCKKKQYTDQLSRQTIEKERKNGALINEKDVQIIELSKP